MATAETTAGAGGGTAQPERRFVVTLVAIGMLSVVGMGIGLDLTNVYVQSRIDPDFNSFCAVSEGVNCETVAISDYSTVFGTPVSLWAIAGYAFVAFLAFFAAVRRGRICGPGLLLLFGVFFLAVSIWLVYVMHFLIHSLCLLCLAIDVVNVSILILAIVAVKQCGRSMGEAIIGDVVSVVRRPVTLGTLVFVGVGLLAGAWYFGDRVVSRMIDAPKAVEAVVEPEGRWADRVRASESGPSCEDPEHNHVQKQALHGASNDGHQWVGAQHPVIEIQEFTDYQCPYCRRAHMMVRKLVAREPGRVRVYHRHLPLDSACNPQIKQPLHDRACELSRIAVCAGHQGRFWEMNDFLFQHAVEIKNRKLSPVDIAKRLELDADEFDCCMANESNFEVVRRDIVEGNSLGLKGTPAFIIGGTVYYGKIPDEALSVLDQGL